MEDIRLKHEPFEFDGRTYMLSCNMNVLADVQSAYGGDISRALNGRATTASFLEFLTAMLNDIGAKKAARKAAMKARRAAAAAAYAAEEAAEAAALSAAEKAAPKTVRKK